MRSRLVVVLTAGLIACGAQAPTERRAGESRLPSPPVDRHERALASAREELLAEENRALGERDFAVARPQSDTSGPNPVRIRRLEDGYLGMLNARDEVVELDARGQVRRVLPAPAGARGWAWQGELGLAVGERSPDVFVFAARSGSVDLVGRFRLEGVHALRDVAIGPASVFYVADRHRGHVYMGERPAESTGGQARALPVESIAACPGATQVQVAGRWLLANCLLTHRLEVLELSPDGRPTGRTGGITHDGPIWAFDAHSEPSLRIVAVGVEDHPLDRTDGAFGYIDSFAFVYAADPEPRGGGLEFRREHEINLSAHGVVTPKWVRFDAAGTAFTTTGYGGERGAVVDLRAAVANVRTYATPPGLLEISGDLGGNWLGADPLLDRWILGAGSAYEAVEVERGVDERDPLARLGEALAFTTLMGPGNTSEGPRSRFTCETCHFEGTVDGRVHFTGRGETHATTKTLRGLFGNRPHFSRALDRTTTGMIENEFKVVSRGTPTDPWFAVTATEHPWLGLLWPEPSAGPEVLRKALLRFFVDFNPDANPATLGRSGFTSLEREGAGVFAKHCERCHQARLRADDEGSRVPPEGWESAIFSHGAILWGSDQRRKVGVLPYVHAEGARDVPLRRLWVKRPLLTNGSALTLTEVLSAFDAGGALVHAPGLPSEPLSAGDQDALAAFVDLL